MIIIAPLKTEKAIRNIEKANTVTFVVSNLADEKQIKSEVEKIFNVKVLRVNTQTTFDGKKIAFVKLKKEYKAEELVSNLKMLA